MTATATASVPRPQGPLAPGDALTPLALAPISRTTLALFAGASGDHNPIHIDLDVAHSAGLDDVFAHGMLSMAYLGRFLTANVAQPRIREWGVRFTAITPVHAEPVCTGSVREVVERDGERLAVLDIAVTLADGTVTLRGDAFVTAEPVPEAAAGASAAAASGASAARGGAA